MKKTARFTSKKHIYLNTYCVVDMNYYVLWICRADPLPTINYTVESLQSHCIHTQSHWSSGSTLCFPSWGTQVQSPGRYFYETRILLLELSRFIGDPDVIDHCGLVWDGLLPEPSLGCRADNVIIPLDLTQLFCPGFTLAAGPPSEFTTDIVGC